MAIWLIDTLKQKNNGKFPLIDSNDVKGGFYQADSITERNSIPTERRKEGMFCWVSTLKIVYQLVGGIENSKKAVFSDSEIKSLLEKNKMLKKSVVIANRHQTSISIEPEFWNELVDIAKEKNLPINQLVTIIDKEKSVENLSSAIRLYVLNFLKSATRNLI